MALINQQLRQQESAQPINRTVPTTFRGTRRLQQPKPLSTTPLSASTATHNTNLYGTIAFLEENALRFKCLSACLCVSAQRRKLRGRNEGKRARQCVFLKSLSNSKRMHITLTFLCRCLQLPFPLKLLK